MLRYIRDLLGWNRSTLILDEEAGRPATTVVYLRVGVDAPERFRASNETLNQIEPTFPPPQLSQVSGPGTGVVANGDQTGLSRSRSASRKARDSKSIRSLGLFSRTLAGKLESLGLHTAGDLLACNPHELATGEASLARRIRRAQRAIRFSRRFPDMTPPDALLLFAVHRRSRKTIASEPPALLRRDIQRLLISSRGQKRWGGRPVPPIAQIKTWVNAAQRS